MSSSKVRNRTRHRFRAAIVLGACAPVLAACATGFASPSRHAVANLQAARATVGSTLQIEGAIIALPDGSSSPKGGLAYLQFNAINLSDQADELVDVSVQPPLGVGSSAAADASSGAPSAAGSLQAASDTVIPAKTSSAPGAIRVSVLLRDLTATLAQGESVTVGLTFKNSGSVSGLLVPVQSSDVVGSAFLPSAPPPAPSAPASSTPLASTSPTPVESGASSEAPSSPAASGSAPVGSASAAPSS